MSEKTYMGIKNWLRMNVQRSGLKQRFPQLHALAGLASGHPKHFIERKIIGQTNNTVAGGPFYGMKYISESTGSVYVPKLIGSYECELIPCLNELLANPYDVVIDIGCAEGYYAVGLALRLPEAHIFAFDTDENAQRLCRKLARLNGVENRMTIGGFCDSRVLSEIISDKTLIICDCEGYEMELMDTSKSPSLAQADILVELHDFLNSAISSTIASRFRETHNVTMIDSGKERAAADFPVLSVLSKNHQEIATNELRPGIMQWACMAAKHNAGTVPQANSSKAA